MNKIFKHDNIKLWILFALTLLIAVISFGYLPDQIPIHFDAEGNVDNYGGRIYIFLEPFIIFAMIILAETVRNIDPKKAAYSKFNKQYYLIFFLVSLLMLAIQLYTIACGMNAVGELDISIIMPFIMGLLFTVIGNSMPKFKQNYYAGIRTSWTLSDEEVWYKTHRLGGKVWFAGGLSIMISAILPAYIKFKVLFGAIIIMVLVPIIYSYVIYKDKNK